MAAAQEEVLATPELLELILVELPMRDLLVTVPLVSTTWQATTRTPALQHALFFLPNLNLPSSSAPVKNPLLVELFPPFFIDVDYVTAVTIMAMPWARAPAAFKRKEASWRHMLVTQPPARTVAVTELRVQWARISVRHARWNEPTALRIGKLYDLAVPFIDRVRSSFRIRWHGAPGDGVGVGSDTNLTLDIRYIESHKQLSRVDKQFESDANQAVDIEFGEWGPPPG
ncbi:putative f-box domain protein [Mycena sanguinolenta]|uniref:Putative f-box domain protein n=1 Tax=Mycena sanguinolenta TaxID=230812 RepID=A0A8H6XLE8_9AGAR|nr:putative f-box domain protein [Mycena sanguinolenta]